MSSIAKTGISISKKDLVKSRIPPVASRNVVFYHKALSGDMVINLLALTMPSSEIPTATQASIDELSGARLTVNKKNLKLTSSYKGELIQGMDYLVIDSMTIKLIGIYESTGAEPEEIFIGIINSAPVSDLVVASAKSVDKTYTLNVGQTTLNLAQEYKVGFNPNDDIGVIKVFVNGVLAIRDTDYQEVDSGNGYGTTIEFFVAPPSIPYQVVVDFGVMSITDNDAIGAIESLSGSIKKIADDLSVVAGTSANDYLNANPSEVERRAFGDMVLRLNKILDVEVPVVTDWVDTGPITITATTTNPTKATTKQQDSVRWRQVGDSYEVEYRYNAASATGAANGSGDYVFSLPNGVEITDDISNQTSVANLYLNPQALGTMEVVGVVGGSGSAAGLIKTAVKYSSNSFRIRGENEFNTSATVSSGNYALNQANLFFYFTVKFRGKNLQAKQKISDIIGV